MLVTNDEVAFEAYHLYPTTGLLNDPNGLVFFKGKYHVFYQWNPKACNHKYKEWGHFISDDLKSWGSHRIFIGSKSNAFHRSYPSGKSL